MFAVAGISSGSGASQSDGPMLAAERGQGMGGDDVEVGGKRLPRQGPRSGAEAGAVFGRRNLTQVYIFFSQYAQTGGPDS